MPAWEAFIEEAAVKLGLGRHSDSVPLEKRALQVTGTPSPQGEH